MILELFPHLNVVLIIVCALKIIYFKWHATCAFKVIFPFYRLLSLHIFLFTFWQPVHSSSLPVQPLRHDTMLKGNKSVNAFKKQHVINQFSFFTHFNLFRNARQHIMNWEERTNVKTERVLCTEAINIHKVNNGCRKSFWWESFPVSAISHRPFNLHFNDGRERKNNKTKKISIMKHEKIFFLTNIIYQQQGKREPELFWA